MHKILGLLNMGKAARFKTSKVANYIRCLQFANFNVCGEVKLDPTSVSKY